jgi:hypothetical protein
MCKKLIYLFSFVLMLSMSSNASAELVAHWRFDERSGTTPTDTSSNGRHGEFVGYPEWATGISGGALQTSQGNYMVVPGYTGVLGTNARTCSAWIKTLTPNGVIFGWGLLGPGNKWILRVNHLGVDGELRCEVHNGYHYGTTKVNDNEWHHVAVVLEDDGSPDIEETKLYVDGVLETTGDSADEPINTIEDMDVTIGQNPHASDRWFDGLLDDLRIYNHALSEVEILGAMKGEPWPFAFGPDPADGGLHSDTWVNISWKAGDFAVSHDIYIGDDFNAVNEGAEGTFIGNQTNTFLVVGFPGFPFPEGLVPGTTYYWRIDEVNEAEPNSPWKGEIWSFSIPPKTAYFPDPADGAESVGVNAELSWTGGYGSKLHTVYFGETFDEVDSATGGSSQGSTSYTPGTLKMAKTYYWRVDEFDVVETHKGDIWSFITEGAVGTPEPAKGAVDVTQTPVLTWTPGLGATYEVCFGTDPTFLELKGSGNLGSESYDPGQLEWNTTYYWRVDEADSANADSPWTGPLWNFTTANFLIIDDMESYNDIEEGQPGSNRIYVAWADGFDDPTNGSQTGHLDPPFYEETIVHSGNKSMPIYYDNAVGKSEATLTLTDKRDWTVNGVDTLTIWFRGESDNAAEQMYVALNGSARVDHDNPDAATLTIWTTWSIDLEAFTDQGVNLANVDSITLGLSSVTGGTGMIYFDDIRLYPPAN